MNHVVEIHDLSMVFNRTSFPFFRNGKNKSVTALDNINLSVTTAGEIIFIFGNNGSGKTTLLKCIAGLVTPTNGAITVFGKNHKKDGLFLRSHLGMQTDQERSFYWRLSGRENIHFFAGLHTIGIKEIDKRIDRLSELLEVKSSVDKPFSECSTGTRQRFSLMRALIHKPSLLLLDEPTRSLDDQGKEKLWALLNTLSVEKKITTICTSPDGTTPSNESIRHLRLDQGKLI